MANLVTKVRRGGMRDLPLGELVKEHVGWAEESNLRVGRPSLDEATSNLTSAEVLH